MKGSFRNLRTSINRSGRMRVHAADVYNQHWRRSRSSSVTRRRTEIRNIDTLTREQAEYESFNAEAPGVFWRPDRFRGGVRSSRERHTNCRAGRPELQTTTSTFFLRQELATTSRSISVSAEVKFQGLGKSAGE